MPAPPPYKPSDAERAFVAAYSACHALAVALERLLKHRPDRADLEFLRETVNAQLARLGQEATERTGPVLSRIRTKYARTPHEEIRR